MSIGELSFLRAVKRGSHVSRSIEAEIVRRPAGAVVSVVSSSSRKLLIDWLCLCAGNLGLPDLSNCSVASSIIFCGCVAETASDVSSLPLLLRCYKSMGCTEGQPMASCVREPPRLRAPNRIAYPPIHINLRLTSTFGISVNFAYHNLDSWRDGQFGRVGGTKAPVVPGSSPAGHQQNADDLAVQVGWPRGLF